MKKYLVFIIVAGLSLLFASCASNSDIANLQSQIDDLKSGRVASIESQISSITTSISALQEADREIKGFITALQNTASDLQKSINTANGKIDDLQKALTLVNTAIETLQAKDRALEKRIDDLKDYVDTQLKNARDWVSATFATLEQYNGIVSEIGGIKGSISSINAAMQQMESRLNGKITLMKGEIEEAYTKAIGALESSLKNWVNEQLEGYWTIAETEGKLETLEGNLTQEDESIRGDIGNLRTSLDSARTELTEGYKAAIKKAIEENSGMLDGKLSEVVSGLNTRIEGEVSTINERIGKLEKRVLDLELAVSELLSRIQSLTYIPRYTDGASTMWVKMKSDGTYEARDTLEFRVSPADCADSLVEVWDKAITAEAVSLATRASQEVISLPVVSVTGGKGKISVVLDGSSLGEKFFTGEQQMKAVVIISDGNNELTSDYISMVPKVVPLPEAVDLGLSVKWASFNVGASKPEDYGNYYAWGEVETKDTYTWETYKWCNGSYTTITKYNTNKDYGTVDYLTTLLSEDDAAIMNLGGHWRIPTRNEVEELFANCTSEWIMENGIYGRRFTSKKTGYTDKSIFIPAAGFYDGIELSSEGSFCCCWTATLALPDSGSYLLFCTYSYVYSGNTGSRDFGFPIRPVMGF